MTNRIDWMAKEGPRARDEASELLLLGGVGRQARGGGVEGSYERGISTSYAEANVEGKEKRKKKRTRGATYPGGS
jgi:hypothetical protein